MKNGEDFLTLRTRAEKTIAEQDLDLSKIASLEEAQHLIRELQLQQFELEIQNQELLKANRELFSIQEQLDNIRKKYAEHYDFAPVGYCTVDPHGGIVETNVTAAEQFGVNKERLLQSRFHDYIVKDDQAKFAAYFNQAFATRTRQIAEMRLQGKRAGQFSARLDSILVQDGEDYPTLCRIAISDITELDRARAALLRREGELALFNRVSQAFHSPLALDQILLMLLEEVRRLLEVAACSIWLVDPETHELVCRQAIGPHRDAVLGWRLDPGQGIAGWVVNNGESLIVPDSWTDERHFNGVDRLTGSPLYSIMAVPMRNKHKVIGVLQVLDTQANRFTATDQALQELLAALASLAIENMQLTEQVRQDASTKNILLYDVTHRGKNMLATMIRLFSVVRRHSGLKKHSISRALMTDMINRVKGLASVQKLLAEFQWNPLPLSELTRRVIQAALEGLAAEKRVTVEISPVAVRITPDQADSLGLVINELATNVVKHALHDRAKGRITVQIAQMGETVYFEFQDDGPGWPADIVRFDRHNVGFYLIQKIVRKELDGRLELYNEHGAVAEIRFKTPVQSIIA